MAEALATVTPALTRATPARPPAAQLRAALYQHAFNPARTAMADPAAIGVLPPARIARRAGHNITVLLTVYTHCIDGQDDITNRQIEHALRTRTQAHHQAASSSKRRRATTTAASRRCPDSAGSWIS